jgi:flagellar basal-body rod modification protein FlgD
MPTITDPITTGPPAPIRAASPPPIPTAPRPDAMGKEMFLKLLVAQLKYQNPLAPSDPQAFMAQTAQLSMVERLEEMSKASTELLAAERSRAATGLLGNQVTWTGADGVEQSGIVSAIRLEAGGPLLTVGDGEIPYALVTGVATAPAATDAEPVTDAVAPDAVAPEIEAPDAPAVERA